LQELKIGRSSEGLQAIRESCKLLRQVVAEQPTSTTYLANLGQALDNLGTSLATTGAPREGKDAIIEAQAIFQKLAHANPDDHFFRSGLVGTQHNLVEVEKTLQPSSSARPTR
jgi:hypothetical protein